MSLCLGGIAIEWDIDGGKSLTRKKRQNTIGQKSEDFRYLAISTAAASHSLFDLWGEAALRQISQAHPAVLHDVRNRSSPLGAGPGNRKPPQRDRDAQASGPIVIAQRDIGQDRKNVQSAARDGFFLYQTSRDGTASTLESEGSHFLLSHRAIENALRAPVPTTEAISRAIRDAAIADVIEQQMLFLPSVIDRLYEDQYQFVLLQLARLLLYVIRDSAQPSPRSPRSMILHTAENYIETHYAALDLDAVHICRELNVSRATLYRAYRERGLTVAGAIRSARLTKAGDMLRSTTLTLSIEAIAENCGFAHTRTFQRAFYEHYGVSPSTFRNRLARLNS